MCDVKFDMIGITDSRKQVFPPEVLSVIDSSTVFSGGKRHHEIVSGLLPAKHEWIDITVPLADVYKQYSTKDHVVVFASGDPMFYGFGATLQREFPTSELRIFPSFNSLQMLAHRLRLPYHNMVNVSLTGRDWINLDSEVIRGASMIGILTDRVHTPDKVARRLLDYGYDNYIMHVGENLGNEELEKVRTMALCDAADLEFGLPNNIILQKKSERRKYFGIPENLFCHLDGRSKMITKMPIRLLSISMLDLYNRKSLWDIGFCTGSVSIESRLQFPDIRITAFEKRDECREIIYNNMKKFGAMSIQAEIGDFFEKDLSAYPAPDAVFIGGHGGHLSDMIKSVCEVAMPGCVIVFNSVSQESCNEFVEATKRFGKDIVETHILSLDRFNPITILKAQ